MKTRLISGAVLILIVAAVLTLGATVSPFIITAFIAAAASAAAYELLKNAAGIKSGCAVAGSCIYVFLNVFALNPDITLYINRLLFENSESGGVSRLELSAVLGIVWFVFASVMTLVRHRYFSLSHIAVLTAMPIPLSFAFSCLESVLSHSDGIYYLLLLLNFSSICDMGAYFVGSTVGKHKLCPQISPHKTIEGAVGGIVSSMIVTLILLFSFSMTEKLAATLILTVPFCMLGMLGDLFASAVKRTAGIKDYGRLIPGHGGILDRFDSIIMIAPLFYLFIMAGVI